MTPAERNAIAFVALLAAAGAGARIVGIGDPPDGAGSPTPADRRALQHQLAAVDSARADRDRGRGTRRVRGRVPRAPVVAAVRGPLDVNAADSVALEALPGVGPALAHRIVADRAARGPYGSLADLSRVPGIGAALEQRLAPAVTFTPGGRPSSGSVSAPDGARRGAPAGATRGARTRWPAP